MDIKNQILNILADIAGDSIVKDNLDIAIFEEGIIDSFKTIELLLAIENQLGIDVSITDFDREVWATPNKIIALLSAKQ
ncbi:D-alanine--poly(phosphoribitol) ligase subunit 2 [Staphylococcus arlettae]|uniref:D-alanine--poly(phosphoribitol) ligase subunit 2 n=1 Tax=Staphylococcus arlettae TaxID=29378 RepID=UPI000D1AE384|nr:D-alanine--poly(phosphoribitol) ligase subunit 2 [Staphylococcus arlettae]PTH24050.1 D-alanine--poly(phosphoribitol) ligase subunit 2 [Staphylococcus arlettae]PTH67462.1 D-alanine--poly(phosphoribitol) ligase subunit 2 [Staphylococcus arlettae]PUZ31883.1 D-alanine--poly(phosphoribitol) ligase subunit 2 [Staphylococcus arlettae]RIM62320.1 D-alanine--poly(phosphoribitol) ligase subunit 2 [Staphylococcus arlettae]RIM72849.1 D-alanine--poly(phosphoribitol) ligase subunit 2 [Staphylococcus arlet